MEIGSTRILYKGSFLHSVYLQLLDEEFMQTKSAVTELIQISTGKHLFIYLFIYGSLNNAVGI